jgi:hypothetical protein
MSIRETCRFKESLTHGVWIFKGTGLLLHLLLLHSGLTFAMSVSRSRKINEDDGAVVLTGRLGQASECGFEKESTLVWRDGAWSMGGSSACLVVELPCRTPHDKPAVGNCHRTNCYRAFVPAINPQAIRLRRCHSERKRKPPKSGAPLILQQGHVDCRLSMDDFGSVSARTW